MHTITREEANFIYEAIAFTLTKTINSTASEIEKCYLDFLQKRGYVIID